MPTPTPIKSDKAATVTTPVATEQTVTAVTMSGKNPERFTEAQLHKRSREDRITHLESKIARLKRMPRNEVGESLRRAEIDLANTKESLKQYD